MYTTNEAKENILKERVRSKLNSCHDLNIICQWQIMLRSWQELRYDTGDMCNEHQNERSTTLPT